MAPTAKGFTAVMAQRREPPDALDYFPTPPWATRALFRHVLPALGIEAIGRVWEPACGEGHMAAVIAEFARSPVVASDVFSYGYGTAPHDFLHDDPLTDGRLDHHQSAVLDRVRVHLARARSRRPLASPCWCARNGSRARVVTRSCFAIGRQRSIAPFVERVPMVKGRWDPDASTATAYAWFVWCRCASGPPRVIWIPPGCRAGLSRPDDRERFAAWSLRPTTAPLFDRL